MEWVFGAIIVACAIFLLQMLLEYNHQRGLVMPQIKQVTEIRARHEEEIEKVEGLTQQAVVQLETLDAEVDALTRTIAELDARIEALNDEKET